MPAAKKTPTRQRRSVKSSVKPELVEVTRPRRVRLPVYKPFRLKRVKRPSNLPSAWSLTRQTGQTLWRHKRVIIWITVIYLILDIVLVNGLSAGTDVGSLKQQLQQTLTGTTGQLTLGLSVFTSLLSSAGGSGQQGASSGVYQLLIGLVISLATIYALRQFAAGEKIGVRETFYKGMYPLIPFILVLIMVLIQTLPFLVGGLLYSVAVNYGIALYTTEKILWGLLFAVLAFVSIYMLCSSLFGLYIVTLPAMTPRKALKNAKLLVAYRRTAVLRKILFLFAGLFIVGAIVMMPFILFAPSIATWVFLVLSLFALIVVHTYMYTLYRELMHD